MHHGTRPYSTGIVGSPRIPLITRIPSANPTWASCGVLTTSPAAQTPSTLVRMYSSTCTKPRSSITTSLPSARRPSVNGRRPTERITASTVTDSPSPKETVVPLPFGLCPLTVTPVCTAIPRFRNDRFTTATTSSSQPVNNVGNASSTVTWLPRSLNIEANSQPIAPPPMMATDAGSFSSDSTSSEVSTTVPSTSNPG